jgi:hypothetical protein
MPEIKKSDVRAANRGYREGLDHANTVGGMMQHDLASFAQFVKDHPERFPLSMIGKP